MLACGVPVLRRGPGGCPGDRCGAAAGVRGTACTAAPRRNLANATFPLERP